MRRGFNPWAGKIPGGGHGNPLQCSCLENPHGQRSLVGYSPWGHTELDTTEATAYKVTAFFEGSCFDLLWDKDQSIM